jgi:hypothetical protein
MSKRRKLVYGLLATVSVVVVVTIGLLLRSDDRSLQEPRPSASQTTSRLPVPTATSSGSTTLAPENAQFLELRLASSDKTEQALALIPDLRKGKWSSLAVLPAGSTLTIDQTSFSVASNGYATVSATVAGSMQGEFILHLAHVDNQWLIYQTEQK